MMLFESRNKVIIVAYFEMSYYHNVAVTVYSWDILEDICAKRITSRLSLFLNSLIQILSDKLIWEINELKTSHI